MIRTQTLPNSKRIDPSSTSAEGPARPLHCRGCPQFHSMCRRNKNDDDPESQKPPPPPFLRGAFPSQIPTPFSLPFFPHRCSLTPTSQRSHTVTTLSLSLSTFFTPVAGCFAPLPLLRCLYLTSPPLPVVPLYLCTALLTVTAIDSRSQQKRTGAERRGRRIVLRENKRIHLPSPLLFPLQIYAGGGWCVRAAPRRRCYAASWSSERARPPTERWGRRRSSSCCWSPLPHCRGGRARPPTPATVMRPPNLLASRLASFLPSFA